MKAIDTYVTKVGKKNLFDMLIGNLGIRRAYKKMMDDNHVPIESMPTKSGFAQGYKFQYGDKDMPLIAADFCESNALLGINFDHVFLAEAYAGKWGTDNGKILTRDKSTDTYWADFKMYTQLYVDDGRTFMKRSDFTEQ